MKTVYSSLVALCIVSALVFISVKSEEKDIRDIPTIHSSVYHNSEYGFTLTFPETWNGYRIEVATTSAWGGEKIVKFGIREQPFVFGVVVYTKPEWQEVKKGLEAENMILKVLGESETYVFQAVSAQDFYDDVLELSHAMPSIFSTFTLDNDNDMSVGRTRPSLYTFSSDEFGFSVTYPKGWPQGWYVATSSISAPVDLIANGDQKPEDYLYETVILFKEGYELEITVTNDSHVGGGTLMYTSGIPNGAVPLSVAGQRGMRDVKPDLCAEVEMPQPKGLCFFIAFIDENFIPSDTEYLGAANHQVERGGRRYIFSYHVPKEYDESMVRELDKILESFRFK